MRVLAVGLLAAVSFSTSANAFDGILRLGGIDAGADGHFSARTGYQIVTTFDEADGSCGASTILAGDQYGPYTPSGTVARGSIAGVRRAPGAEAGGTPNTSCFLSLGQDEGGRLFFPIVPEKRLKYVGFQWGSMDEYNFLRLAHFSGLVPFEGIYLGDETGPYYWGGVANGLDGVTVADFFATTRYSSAFAEIELLPGVLDRISNYLFIGNLMSTAFEIDNITFTYEDFPSDLAESISVIPTPSTATFLLFGLAGVATARAGISAGRRNRAAF